MRNNDIKKTRKKIEDKLQHYDNIIKQSNLLNVKDETKVFDFAIGVGLAYETEMGLTAGFRYLISATKAIDHEKNKNSVFQLTLGWMF